MQLGARYEIERLERAAEYIETSLSTFVLHMGRLDPSERYEHRVAAAVARVILAVELTAEAIDKMDP